MSARSSRVARVELAVGPGLGFIFSGVPGELAQRMVAVFEHCLQGGRPCSTPPIPITDEPPPGPAVLPGPPLLVEPPLTIRRHGNVVVFEVPGIAGWCAPQEGRGGIQVHCLDGAALDHFAGWAVVGMLFQLAVARGWFGLHAAAFELDGHAVVLPGPSGAGKSTLFAQAHDQGLGVLSDDLVWVRWTPEGFRVVAFPRPSGCGIPGPSRDDLPLGAVVFPSVRVGRGGSRMRACTAAAAVGRLASQASFLATGPVAADHFRGLVRLVAGVPCRTLEVGPERDGLAVICSALG